MQCHCEIWKHNYVGDITAAAASNNVTAAAAAASAATTTTTGNDNNDGNANDDNNNNNDKFRENRIVHIWPIRVNTLTMLIDSTEPETLK